MLDIGIPNEEGTYGESKIERIEAAESRIASRQAHTKPWPSNLTAEEMLKQGKDLRAKEIQEEGLAR